MDHNMKSWLELFSNKNLLTESLNENQGNSVTLRIQSNEEIANQIAQEFKQVYDGVIQYQYPNITLDSNVVSLRDMQNVFSKFENPFQGFVVVNVN